MRFCGRTTVIFGLLLLSIGCSNRPDPGEAFIIPKEVPPAAAPLKAKEAVLDPPDHSLTVENYLEAGMPPIDQVWSSKDMTDAARVCGSIAETYPNRLPRRGSTRSDPVFERMTSDENLNSYRDESIPIEKRLTEFLSYMDACSYVNQLYLSAFSKNAVGGTDIVDLNANVIRNWATIRGILNEFVPTMKKSDLNYQARLASLNRIKEELGSVALKSIAMLTDDRYLNTAQQKRFIVYLHVSLPELVTVLMPETKDAVLTTLKEYDANPKMEKLKPELTELLKKVEEASAATAQ